MYALSIEKLQKMDYRKELLPLHARMVKQGKIPSGPFKFSYKREHVEARIMHAIKNYNPEKSANAMVARAKACEEQRAADAEYIAQLEAALAPGKSGRKKAAAASI